MGWLRTYIYDVISKDRQMWCNALHVTAKHNISQGKESKKWHVHSILNKYLEQLGGYIEDLTRNYPGVWEDSEFMGIMSPHVAT
jgi:hypothetical protein